MLGMTPASTSFIARATMGPEYLFAYRNFIQNDLTQAWWTALAGKALADNSDLAAEMANSRLAAATYVALHRPLSEVMVAPDPLGNLPAPGFIAQMAAWAGRLSRA